MNQFRIGGVYRTNSGAVVDLFNEGRAWGGTGDRVFNGLNLGGKKGSNNGQWLPDGRFYNGIGDQIAMSLIPGELHQVNGEWLPIDTNPAWTQAVDRAAQKYMGENVRPVLTWADTKPADRWEGYVVYSDAVSSGFVESPKHTHSHPLQKMAEGKEGFGSAALLKG